MNLLKIFFLSILLFLLPLFLFSATSREIYRSNSNGLKLIKISSEEAKEFKYILFVFLSGKNITRKILYEGDDEIKRWVYYYKGDFLSHEEYIKDNIVIERYHYDAKNHKVKQEEFKNQKKSRMILYSYNSDGLVDLERVQNFFTNQIVNVKYKYDSDFKIKQIEKKFKDGKLVYWEAFFSEKGIIEKEYYTLENERYTFWYNENGQEIGGEVKEISAGKKEKIKKDWKTYYSNVGKKQMKHENNYVINEGKKVWYNSNYKETRIEIYKDDKVQTIETFDYNEKELIIYYELIKDLFSTKIIYKYDENDNMKRSLHFQDDELKKDVTYNKDKSRKEILYGKDKKVLIEYDIEGNAVSQEDL